MGFFSKVARDFSRDIQVIITGEGGKSSKPKRQRYDPAKAKKRKFKGKFKRKYIPRADFLKKMQEKYSDKATTLNTETQRDLSADDLRGYSLQALGRLLRLAIRNGNEHMMTVVEREIDRRTKGMMLSRFSRRR